LQAVGRRGRRRQDIDIHLLKPARFRPEPGWALPPAVCDGVIDDDVWDPAPEWMLYEYRTAHLVLCWLLTKLAEWIGANLSEGLLIPDKTDDKWTAAELNSILLNNVVRGPYCHLRTFGGIQWECDLLNGRPKALCYSFDIVGHRFWDKNPLVAYIVYDIAYDVVYDIIYDIIYYIQHYITYVRHDILHILYVT
jgi:hypothetical protein